MTHRIIGCSRLGSKWRATCACSWRSTPRFLPSQTYLEWRGHLADELDNRIPFPRVLPPRAKAS